MQLIRISPSQIKTKRRCKRLWGYQKLDGIKEPETPKQKYGTIKHKEAEDWLRDGKMPSDVVAQGIKPGVLPTPGPHLILEGEFEYAIPEFPDVRLTGFADLIEAPDLERPYPLIGDHKFTGDAKWAMEVEQIIRDPQALIYARYAMQKFKARQALMRFIYYLRSWPQKGEPKPKGIKPVEHLFSMADPAWAESWRELIADIADIREYRLTLTHAEQLPQSPDGCEMFGGCYFGGRMRGYENHCPCKVDDADYLGSLITQYTRENSEKKERLPVVSQSDITPATTNNTPKENEVANLFEKLSAGQEATAAATAPAAPPAEAPATSAPLLETLAAKADATGVNPPAREPHQAAAEAAAADDDASPYLTEDELDELKVSELRALAKEKGITGVTRMKREPLVAAINAWQDNDKKAKQAPPPTPAAPATPPAQAAAPTPPAQAPSQPPIDEASGQEAKGPGLVVFLNCGFLKRANGFDGVINLADWVKPVADLVAKANGVEHWGLIDYAKGAPMLAAKVEMLIDKAKPQGVIMVDKYSLEGKALSDVLKRKADTVVGSM